MCFKCFCLLSVVRTLSFKCLFTFLRAFDFDKIFRYNQHLSYVNSESKLGIEILESKHLIRNRFEISIESK